jgi:hypothetical protein
MAVDSSQLNSESRDAYWWATQCELKSARLRGDILSLAGLAPIAALLWFYRESGDNLSLWAVGVATVALAIVALPQVLVVRRRRRISNSRGLNCLHCGYVPHQTEISEVAGTRECRRCQRLLG